jgi:hypothetical protein
MKTQTIKNCLACLVVAGSSSALDPHVPPPLDIAAYCNGTDNIGDSACILTWIDAGHATGRKLFASNGTYLYKQTMPLRSGLSMSCQHPWLTQFRNIGGTGVFLAAATEVTDVAIQSCGFDVNGNPTNFLAVISVNPGRPTRSRNIRVRANRFHDSAIPGRMSAAQRQYILLLNCDECVVENNRLSEGGRIKVGRPGSKLVIRENLVENANDNAITVVDIGAGVSEDILIQGNRVVGPRGVGIFFGADGEDQPDAGLTTRKVRISGNQIQGDWITACILGMLPEKADDIRVTNNRCLKTGTCGLFSAGISIRRTVTPTSRATNIVVDHNTIESNIGWVPGSLPALDMGGIFVGGIHDGVSLTNNKIAKVGPRAIFFHISADVTSATVTGNIMTGGNVVIDGTVTGVLSPNTVAP